MIVELNMTRLCVHARFLNLSMKDTPLSLETLVLVSCFTYRNCHFSKIDHKSGYDHILISADSQQFFGVEWMGLNSVSATLPFMLEKFPFCLADSGFGPHLLLQELGN